MTSGSMSMGMFIKYAKKHYHICRVIKPDSFILIPELYTYFRIYNKLYKACLKCIISIAVIRFGKNGLRPPKVIETILSSKAVNK